MQLLQCFTPQTADGQGQGALDIDTRALCKLCSDGVPNEVPALRAVAWKLLLGYLPADAREWEPVLATARGAYAESVGDLAQWLARPDHNDFFAGGAEEPTDGLDEAHTKLSRLTGLLDQVMRDVVRTGSELDFLSQTLDGRAVAKPDARRAGVDVNSPRCHYDVLARILLVYARSHAGAGYLQGMSWACAPLYCLFAQDPLSAGSAEADTFFCFSLLMESRRDSFAPYLEDSAAGCAGLAEQLGDLLRANDRELWEHLERSGALPALSATRWLRAALTQGLPMPDVFRLWDALISDTTGTPPLLHRFCVAMIMKMRGDLLVRDAEACADFFLESCPQVGPLLDDAFHAARQLQAGDSPARCGQDGPRAPASPAQGCPIQSAARRQVVIDSAREVEGITWYTIKLTEDGAESFYEKRYSDFRSFDRQSRLENASLNRALPKLPESGTFGLRHRFDVGNFNAKRKTSLQQYLNVLTSNVPRRTLKDFLGEAIFQEQRALPKSGARGACLVHEPNPVQHQPVVISLDC